MPKADNLCAQVDGGSVPEWAFYCITRSKRLNGRLNGTGEKKVYPLREMARSGLPVPCHKEEMSRPSTQDRLTGPIAPIKLTKTQIERAR